MTALVLVIVFVASRAPSEFHQLSLLFQNKYGIRSGMRSGTPYGYYSFNTDIILNAIVYVACALHPIVYFGYLLTTTASLVLVLVCYINALA